MLRTAVLDYIEKMQMSDEGVGFGAIQYNLGIESPDLVGAINDLVDCGDIEYVNLQFNEFTERAESTYRSVRKATF